jgi:hypothetical protein
MTIEIGADRSHITALTQAVDPSEAEHAAPARAGHRDVDQAEVRPPTVQWGENIRLASAMSIPSITTPACPARARNFFPRAPSRMRRTDVTVRNSHTGTRDTTKKPISFPTSVVTSKPIRSRPPNVTR